MGLDVHAGTIAVAVAETGGEVRDAERLARCYRAGELTAVWVPDAAHEALRGPG